MFTTMKKLTLAATLGTVIFTGFATAKQTPGISMIDVSASYAAAEDTNAQELFPGITDDIKLAIAELVSHSDDAADPIIRIDIRKVALDGDTMMTAGAAFNQLEGVVSVESENGVGGGTFPLNITALTDETVVPTGYIAIPPSTEDFYDAMVVGFALNVAERVEEMNLSGTAISR